MPGFKRWCKKIVLFPFSVLMGVEGDPVVTPAKGPETFTREYVHELREENKAMRIRATESERVASEATAASAKIKTDSEAASATAIAEAKKTSDERIIRAELKALATAAGIKKVEYLKMADVSTITLDADGNVVGADKIIEAMKKDMPDIFGVASTTSTTTPPKPDDQKPKKVSEMTPSEYEVARKELLKAK